MASTSAGLSIGDGFIRYLDPGPFSVVHQLSPDQMCSIISGLRSGNVIELDLTRSVIDEPDASRMVAAIHSEGCKLEHLFLRYTRFKLDALHIFLGALKSKHCALKTLNLKGVGVSIKIAESLADALKSEYCQLSTLSLSRNVLHSTSQAFLVESIRVNKTLTTLRSKSCGFKGDSQMQIKQCLERNQLAHSQSSS